MAWPLAAWLMVGSMAQGGATSAVGAYYAEKMGEYQREVNDYAIKYSKAVQDVEQARIQRDVSRVLSAQRAQTAASGFTNEGTPLELQAEAQMMGELDTMILRMAGGIERMRINVGGTMALAEGKGIAAGYYAKGSGTLQQGLMAYGARQGWFSPTPSSSLMAPANNPQPTFVPENA